MNESKRLKRQSYFVTAAIDLIQQNGVGKLTARAVADAAGFNQASIYNYFENMDHLENLASIYFTDQYARDLSHATESIHSGLESYMIMWEIFLLHALKNPDLFYNVFYSTISQSGRHNLFKEYYSIFPERRTSGSFISGMMEIDVTQNRGLFVLNLCTEEGSLPADMVPYINDIHIGYTKCVMTDIVKNQLCQPTPALYHKCMCYLIYSMEHFVAESKRPYLEKLLAFHRTHTDKYVSLCGVTL